MNTRKKLEAKRKIIKGAEVWLKRDFMRWEGFGGRKGKNG